jgi:hypothetical protein
MILPCTSTDGKHTDPEHTGQCLVCDADLETRLRDQVCPQCKKDFRLTWRDYERDGSGYRDVTTTLCIRSCPSGGIYDVSIKCPNCDYEEPL